MRSLFRILLAGLFCVGVAAGVLTWLLNQPPASRRQAERPRRTSAGKEAGRGGRAGSPRSVRGKEMEGYFLAYQPFEDGGFSVAYRHMAPIRDLGSLDELREAVRGRGRRAISALRAQYDQLRLDSPPTQAQTEKKTNLEKGARRLEVDPFRDSAQTVKKTNLETEIGFAYMYEGKFPEASSWMEKALESSRASEGLADVRSRLTALLGIIAMRRGEIENCLECVGPSSCIFPISREAVHRNQAGSREAVRWFTTYLESAPRDLRVIWLLNIAYMTLGEYPEKVPQDYRLPAELYRSEGDIGRFTNAASLVGLGARGPNLAGGSIFDDLNGDSLPDLFTTSLDADMGASLYINRGDGTFEDRSAWAGLGAQVYALNVTRADFDNDGDLDLLLLRGAWEAPYRLSLLRNRGNGSFDDVTVASGLAEPIATESAAWGDYDNDGFVDVFVCGEYLTHGAPEYSEPGEPRNRCRLYHNMGDGTFKNVAAEAGVLNERCAKGSAWGDYDGDGRLDLFVSNMGQECRLYHNEGDGKFRDVAAQLGITGADTSFACWFWDYDNDGLLDLYVNDFKARVAEVLWSAMGIRVERTSRPRCYRNLGSAGFRDLSIQVGLDRVMAPMGANFGDVDNDGFLDIYLGTGDMSYEGLEVNLMLRNVGGASFQNITTSSGTGHLQKGHGVSFADWDCDGDLDVFIELGGATPGDQAFNALFQNPGQGHHWLKIKLVGTKTNRAALGAKIQVDVKTKDGQPRSIHRTVGNNSSFGGNSLVETIGLGETTRVAAVTISWPTSKTTQTFRDLAADQAIVITEGTDSFKVLRQPPLPVPTR